MLDPRLVNAISEVFDIPSEQVRPESSSETLVEWDSVGHLKLILHLEETFQVRFPALDIPKLVSAGVIQEHLNRLQGGS